MHDLSNPLLLAAVIGTFFIAGTVKGVTGMGLPTVAMGVLGALVSPLAAASLLVVPAFVTNVWQIFPGSGLPPLARRLWPMMLAILIGTMGGASLLVHGDMRLTTRLLGTTLVIYSLYTLLARQLHVPQRLERWLSPAIGLATGLVTGASGVFVVPAVPYLQALAFGRDELVQALGLSFTVSTIALAAGLAGRGAFHTGHLALSALSVAPALAGMWAGRRIRARVSPPAFRRWFLTCLLLLGAEMLARSL